jgi:hypothetical protein
MLRISLAALALAFTLVAGSAVAGIVDTPVPVGYQHVYSVAGAMHTGNLATFVQCTNADTSSVTTGVQVFGPTGVSLNNPVTSAVSMAVGSTVLFGTQTAAGFSVDADLGTGPFSKGSARILASSKKIICTAWTADVSTNPPVSTTSLTIVKGVKQKAAN